TAEPTSSTQLSVSPATTQAAANPTTGTSNANGTSTPAGCRASSTAHMPKPKTVATQPLKAIMARILGSSSCPGSATNPAVPSKTSEAASSGRIGTRLAHTT